jgi:transcriptional regulator with XRE-family HTH domain
MLSREFRAAIKLSRLRQYQLANLAGVHPATLSAWLNGVYRVRVNDPRILRLAALVGVTADACFEVDPPQTGTALPTDGIPAGA